MRGYSEDYIRALDAVREHHATSKTYSGKLFRSHAPHVKKIIDELGVRSFLDYGCGKGKQYEWVSHSDEAAIPEGMTIEQFWGLPVTKYDPGYPPYAEPPTDAFDLVIITHVLGSIPTADLGRVLSHIYDLTRKAVYIAERIGEVGKGVFADPAKFPRWTAAQWRSYLVSHRSLYRGQAPKIWIDTREKTDAGTIHTGGWL